MKIFFDPERRRWKKTIKILAILIGIFTILTYSFIISILINPQLPALGLHSLHLLPKKSNNNQKLEKKMQFSEVYKKELAKIQKIAQKKNNLSSQGTNQQNPRKTFAYYVEWDKNSFISLEHNINRIDYFLPVWLTIDKNSGTMKVIDEDKMSRTLAYMKSSPSSPKILPVINNYDDGTNTWLTDEIDQILDDQNKSARLIADLKNFVESRGLAGISLDLEDIPSNHYKKFQDFSKNLWTEFKKDNLLVTSSVTFDDEELNYSELSKWNDYLILMAYDEHWSTSNPGAVASQSWFEKTLNNDQKLIPKEKMVIALGNYGYDWQTGTHKEADSVTFQDALQIAQDSEGDIYFDDKTMNPTFDYYDDNNQLHHVFYLDAVTAFNERKFADNFGPAGYALWRLGSEDPTYWEVMKNDYLQNIDQLKTVNNLYDINYDGAGDVLKLKNFPQTGTRNITYDHDVGLITDEDFSKYPLPFTISRYGKSGTKEVALTFDDGPDPIYTPQILDILKTNKVQATFFVIGSNGEKYMDLLMREKNEGNLIGNHTFTHPNITFISDEQMRLELNLTQRLFESVVGIQSLLFRPPYAEDIEPESVDEVLPLKKVSELGYYTIGISIDPGDWQTPGVDQIVQNTLDQAEHNKGGVVLLHDGGGDRTQTIAALPLIIQKLKANGFTVVPLNKLLGVNVSTLNPPVSTSPNLTNFSDAIYFSFMRVVGGIINALFFFSLYFGILRMFLLLIFALVEKVKYRAKRFDQKYHPQVSIIIAAYNEEKVIKQMVEFALNSDYKDLEVIIIDDGSTDRTLQILQKNFQHVPRVKILSQKNQGKAKAINFAAEHAHGEILVLIDADTVIDKKSVSYLVQHFSDVKVAAVAGNAKVGNRTNLLTNFQALEYVTNQNLERRAFHLINSITVVPGAIGAWRKDIFIKMGGFNDHTLAEDNDMTIQMLRAGYTIGYEENAYAYTESPATFGTLAKQRMRWTFGTLQVFWKNRDAIFRTRYGSLAFLGLPNTFFFQIFSPILLPFIDISLILGFCLAFWKTYQHADVNSIGMVLQFIFYYALFTFLDFLTVVTAFLLERKKEWRLLLFLFPQRLFYRFFMNYICLKSLFCALKGSAVHWNKAERKGNVKIH